MNVSYTRLNVQMKTDAICGGLAHLNLSGLLQRWRAAQQMRWRVDVYL